MYSPISSLIFPPPIEWFSVRPPTRPSASRTTTDRLARTSARAAVRPASPAPTIATSTRRVASRGDDRARAADGSAETTPAAVAPPINWRRVIDRLPMAREAPTPGPSRHPGNPAHRLRAATNREP